MATVITISKKLNSDKYEILAMIVLLKTAATRTLAEVSEHIRHDLKELNDQKYSEMQITVQNQNSRDHRDHKILIDGGRYGSVIINIETNRLTTSISKEFIEQNGLIRDRIYINSDSIVNIRIISIIDKILEQMGFNFDETKEQLSTRLFGSNEDEDEYM